MTIRTRAVGVLLLALLLGACTGGAQEREPSLTSGPSTTGQESSAPSRAESAPPSAPTGTWSRDGLPIVAGADGQHLVDQRGDPLLVHAETIWAAMQSLDGDEFAAHMARRHAQGFNAVLMTPVPWIGLDGESMATVDGQRPFEDDGVTFAEEYWAELDRRLAVARDNGITVFLAASGVGVAAEQKGRAWGADQASAMGRAIGERYAATPGIVWLMGVDYRPEDWERYDAEMLAFVDGLRAGGDEHLVTVQYYNTDSTSYDNPAWRGVYQLEAAYTYRPSYGPVLTAYERGIAPVMLIEANFESENNEGGPPTTDETLRRQMLWTYTSGGTGAAYGHRSVWQFSDDWQSVTDTPAVEQLQLIHAQFSSIRWWDLVPDADDALLVEGGGEATTRGTQDGGFADVLESDRATSARSAAGDLAVVYVPTARRLSLDLSLVPEVTRARWFDPTSGALVEVALTADMTPPGANAAGDGDWLLLLDRG
ncbi:DUF4038 domain-containing protein [Oerskovia sp. Root918]|uniref:apiosidase-like domain-containing protein n=1 Tax=Oerskovia sp. Root918 TaxID=1736607 RepID=UPI000B021407|nr:DUF4038 domain-containing protein [Oerskovia sp. Root918]